jgi:hypothetical protein
MLWTIVLGAALLVVLYIVWRRSLRKHQLCARFAVRHWQHANAKQCFNHLVREFGFPDMLSPSKPQHATQLVMWTHPLPYTEIVLRDEALLHKQQYHCLYASVYIPHIPVERYHAMRELSDAIALDLMKHTLSVRSHSLAAIDATMVHALWIGRGEQAGHETLQSHIDQATSDYTFAQQLRQQLHQLLIPAPPISPALPARASGTA